MLDHIFLTVSDLARSVAFYEAVLREVGITVRHDYSGKDGPPGHPDLKGFGSEGRVFFSGSDQSTPKPGCGSCGLHWLNSVADVHAAHAAALAAGAEEIRPPGPQVHYDPRYYAVQLRDPDDYSLEFVFKSWQHDG